MRKMVCEASLSPICKKTGYHTDCGHLFMLHASGL